MIAVRGLDANSLYTRYGVRRTGQREAIAESPVCGATVSTGWELLYLNNYPRPHDAVLKVLSADAELLFCDVNETCMSSFATGWKNGKETWTVFHDSQQAIDHLVTSGELPGNYSEICESRRSDQTEDGEELDDMFGIPIDLFASLTGIRYDMDLPESTGSDFETLEPVEQVDS